MPASRIYTSIIFCVAAMTANAGTAPSSGLLGDRPDVARNVVLVHGAFVDGSSWDRVVRLLQRRGFHVTAVQNPLTSLADDVAATRRVLKQQFGPTILVGHSWGGVVITEAAADDPDVVALVYVAAIAPDIGESTGDVMKHGPAMPAGQAMKPDDTGFLWLDPSRFHDDFAADVSLAETRVLAATQQPIATSAFAAPVTHAAWRNRPSWYVVSDSDRAVSPKTEEWMANRIGATTIHVRASHLSLISQPSAIVQVVEEAARHHDGISR
jgi:pimeloyl-ACP methyl ester carboxylesterase